MQCDANFATIFMRDSEYGQQYIMFNLIVSKWSKPERKGCYQIEKLQDDSTTISILSHENIIGDL